MNNFILIFFFIANIGLLQAQYTAIPDTGFEQNLIDLGIDSEGTLDGQVLTSDIDTITNLHLTSVIYTLGGIEGFSSLETLDVNLCLINLMDLSQNTALIFLDCRWNELTELNLNNNIDLEYLDCYGNDLSNLSIVNNPNLKFFECGNNYFTGLDVSQNPLLETLKCESNSINELVVTQNPLLKILKCSANNIPEIDVSQNILIEDLQVNDNEIQSIEISQNILLGRFECAWNQITVLDLHQNPNIWRFRCNNNQLTNLDLRNGNNAIITDFVATGNPNLSCIFVDDAEYSTDNWTNIDTTSTFVETQAACDTLATEDFEMDVNIRVYPNPANDYFNIYHSQSIEQVKVYSNTGMLIKMLNNQKEYSISELNQGMYIIRIYFDNGIIQRKLIKR